MSFDGVFLDRIKNDIKNLITGRISKINESGDTDYILTVRRDRVNYQIMLSFSSEFSRIHITNRLYDTIIKPKAFTLFLRKHIDGYFIEDISTYNLDRVITFKLKGFNELQDLNYKYLICEIMGRYSNLILTDESFRIIDALKHDGVGEFNRTILPNALYEYPKTLKLNPMELSLEKLEAIIKNNGIETPKDLVRTFNGISLTLANSVFKDTNIAKNLYDLLHIENNPSIIINEKKKTDFYFNPIGYNVVKSYPTIHELLDSYFYDMDMKAKVKAKTGDLLTFVGRHIKKLEEKLIKLNSELNDKLNSDTLKLYGELLLSCPNLKDKKDKVKVLNYYTSEEIEISLDNKYTIIENSNRYYKKYNKQKSSIKFIEEQIEITKNEIEYFNLIKYQLDDASINEALDIQDELIEKKYIFNKKLQENKKKKQRLLTYELESGTLITVGKNNVQNEYLTHKLAKSNEYWFHIKDAPGSHVVLHKVDDLTDDDIRSAAMIASYYSTFKNSSSVPVDYTRVRNIKKIPGRANCFVSYTHQQTIYIDPSEDFINKLKVKKNG